MATAAAAVAQPAVAQAGPTHAEGWYPDYADASRLRWYDGSAWTEHVHPAVPQQAAPAHDYGSNPYTNPYGVSQPTAQQLPANGCMQCGATPAVQVTFRGHRGMLILQTFLTYRGQWCRDCGVAKFRQVQRDTMLLGWWGLISFFVTAFNLVQNTIAVGKVNRLGAPSGRVRSALPAVGTVFASPGFVIAVLLLSFLGYHALT